MLSQSAALLDMRMSDGNGVDVLEKMKAGIVN